MSNAASEPPALNQNVFTEVDLGDDGILWMLNSTVFHPRGLALARGVGEHLGKFFLQGDGAEVWIFQEELAQGKKDAFEAMLQRHQDRL